MAPWCPRGPRWLGNDRGAGRQTGAPPSRSGAIVGRRNDRVARALIAPLPRERLRPDPGKPEILMHRMGAAGRRVRNQEVRKQRVMRNHVFVPRGFRSGIDRGPNVNHAKICDNGKSALKHFVNPERNDKKLSLINGRILTATLRLRTNRNRFKARSYSPYSLPQFSVDYFNVLQSITEKSPHQAAFDCEIND